MTVTNPRRYGQAGFRLLLAALLLLPIIGHAVPAGTVIDNTATASFNGGLTVNSNTVSTTTVVVRTESGIEFLRYAPGSGTAKPVPVTTTRFSTDGTPGGAFSPLPAPSAPGSTAPIVLTDPVPLEPGSAYHQGAPIFMRLTDRDQNLDATRAEAVAVTLTVAATGDAEVLELTETGPNTGLFTGYIQSYPVRANRGAADPANGQLGLSEAVRISATYVDTADTTDRSTGDALVDPFGLVFDSSSGRPVDGVRITLTDAATGLPATVYGDDGVSLFPSTITSGGSATDSSGTVYDFGTGQYRFPFMAPGSYRLQVIPPAGYKAPTTIPTATLQALPGAPYAIDEAGSRGEAFQLPPGTAMQIDIPVDPGAAGFFLVKEADKRVAAVGDFLQYRLTLTNDSDRNAAAAQIVDTLPPGLRYQRGSTTIGGLAGNDPAVGPDARTLTFTLGQLDSGAATEVRYVVEVTAGAHKGDVTNRAIARADAGAFISNEGTASVRITNDFLNDRNTLIGRVVADSCDASEGDTPKGVGGVKLYLEDGTYVVSDEQGMFHIEGVRPGSHVVQMDLETLPSGYKPIVCDEHSRFAGRSFSRFIDLQSGTLWRTDFHLQELPPPSAEVGLEITDQVDGHMATYHLAMGGGDVSLEHMRLVVNLPQGARYVPGSSVLENRTVEDPEARGPVIIYDLGATSGPWARELNFLAEVTPGGDDTYLPAKAFLVFDSPAKANQRTPVVEAVLKRVTREERIGGAAGLRFASTSAELSQRDEAALKRVADRLRGHSVILIEATGHTDNVPINERGSTRFADNFALSLARARHVGEYLAGLLDLPDSALITKGLGATRPFAPNDTERERQRNRRVELRIVTETMVDALALNEAASASNITIKVEGAWQKAPAPARETSSEEVKAASMPEYDAAWVNEARPGLEILWPPEGYNPPIPSIKVAVKHNPGQRLALSLNGSPVNPLNFDTRVTNSSGSVAVSQWAGLDIDKGDNTLALEVRDAEGRLVKRLDRTVRMSSLPVRAELVEERSRRVADGRQTPVIAVRLLDRDNRPVREGLVGEFSIEPPYTAQQDIDDLQRHPLTGLDRGRARYRVGKDGIALIELKPTTRTGEARVVIPLQQHSITLRPWLHSAQRDWILVGLAEGTVAEGKVRNTMEPLSAADLEEGTVTDGRTAFFAKGTIKGEWLLTLAYDSDKEKKERSPLFQEIDPDAYFTIYGDSSAQDYDAASREKLYIRIERRQFYVLFGDYATGLTVTELARYDRSMTGFKSELRDENFSLNMFASDTGQTFVKDEIRGDGTSGLYHLRRPDLVFNSEKVRIEVRDRFRPQLVLSSRPLTRHIDYNIDYQDGTLYFKRPIASKDANLNPIYIVVDYESRADDGEAWTFGGRGAVTLLDDAMEVGASYVNEGHGSSEDTLEGIDATVDFTERTRLNLEYATSRSAGESGNAQRLELRHHDGSLEGTLYYRRRESGFGLGQQSAVGAGTGLYGIDGRYHLTDNLDVVASTFRQRDLQTDAERDVLETRAVYEGGRYGGSMGFLTARDRYSDGTEKRSDQLGLGAHKSFFDNRLDLRIGHYQSLADNANPDYPTRTLWGADYRLNPSTALFMEQELTFGENEDTRGTRVGMHNRPWTGATVNTSLEQRSSEYGARLFANAGLRQTWQVTDHWSMDAGLDSSTTIEDRERVPLSAALPPASGSTEDFTAVSLGASYQARTWSWTSRLERRTGETEDKWGLYSAAAGEPRRGLGLSGRLQVFETESTAGDRTTQTALRLGLVRRPFGRRWTFLNRTDLAAITHSNSGDSEHHKFVNNLLVNYRRRSTQVGTFYGAKYTRDTIDGVLYSGYTDSTGLQLRQDLDKRWDIGARASTLHSWNSELYDYSYGLSVGFNPATNLWLSLGYNWAGYEDEDFSMAGYSAKGVYLKLRFKFDQASVREAAAWFNRQ